jgi:hypothetical protein
MNERTPGPFLINSDRLSQAIEQAERARHRSIELRKQLEETRQAVRELRDTLLKQWQAAREPKAEPNDERPE